MRLQISATLVGFAACAWGQLPTYRVTDLGTLGGMDSQPFGVNLSLQVVGYFTTPGQNLEHAFLYSGGVMRDLGAFGGFQSQSQGINSSGQVVGSATIAIGHGDTHELAFLYTGGVMHDIGTLAGDTDAEAIGINDSGQVVGTSYTMGNTPFHAFLYTAGVMQDIGNLGGRDAFAFGINDAGQVVGRSYLADNTTERAFLYTNGTMHDLGTLGGSHAEAFGINVAGQVVGLSDNGQTDMNGGAIYHAFLYTGGVMRDLGTLGFGDSQADAMNSSGQVVGSCYDVNGYVTFLYSDGVMRPLSSLIDSSGSGYDIRFPAGINDNGYIVAAGFVGDGNDHAVLLSPYFVDNPTAYAIVKGQYVSGSLASLFSIDGSYLVARTNAARQRSAVGVIIVLDGTSSVANPSDLRLLLTGHVNSTNLGQKVEMYDYVANAWVVVDSTVATQSDSTETAIATNPGRFVQAGTRAMKARLSWNPTGIASAFPWSVSIDQAVWNVSP